MGLFGSSSDVDSAHLDCEPQGEYVTEKRVGKIEDVLEDGEPVHYLIRCNKFETRGAGAGGVFGSMNSDVETGSKGYVRAAFTDNRVVVKIPQLMGNDERSIPYDTISTAQFDKGMMKSKITLQTAGAAYEIYGVKPGKDELREALKFVREKIKEAKQPDTVVAESEPDPVEQLEKLKGLHDKGVVSDEEFEEKKQKLMDKI